MTTMRIVFFIIVLLHGLIHLLGFVKGFGLKEIKELTLPISKPMGLFWLAATALFMIYSILHFTNAKYAWLVGLIAVLISQFLVIMFWKDAKFGTFFNLNILVVSLVCLGSYLLKSEFTNQVKYDFSANNMLSTEILTENDISHLPKIVQKYLHYTNSVGQAKVKNF